MTADDPCRSRSAIEDWLCEALGQVAGIPSQEVDPEATFDMLGLDSAASISLIGELEMHLGVELDLALPYEFPTISRLAGEVARLCGHAVTAAHRAVG